MNPIQNHFRLMEALREEKRFLEKILAKTPAREELKKSIRIDWNNGNPKYYIRDVGSGDTIGRYIRKKERDIVPKLIGGEYQLDLRRAVEDSLKKTEASLAHFEKDSVRSVYSKMHPARKAFISPVLPDDDAFAEAWQNETFIPKAFQAGEPEIYSERGERVRSKSEKMLADKFLQLGIPYRYECPLKLSAGIIVHPDFTLLNKRTHEVKYLEHWGGMDRPEYLEYFMWKIAEYEKSGYFPGEKLLLTFESLQHPLNVQFAMKMILRYVE